MKITKNQVINAVLLLLLIVAVVLDTIGQIKVCYAALHEEVLSNSYHLVATWCNYAVVIFVIVLVGYDLVMALKESLKKEQ